MNEMQSPFYAIAVVMKSYSFYCLWRSQQPTNHGQIRNGITSRILHAKKCLKGLISVPKNIVGICVNPRGASGATITRGSEFSMVATFAVNFLILTCNNISMTENFSVYKHSKMWLIFDCIFTAFILKFDCIWIEFWLYLDWNLTVFGLNFHCILAGFWL